MKVVGTHTLQFGLNYHYDQVNERNYYLVNGGFSFSDGGGESGNGFTDFLMGADAGGFTQASIQILDSRSNYAAGYVQDSWRARANLTLNYGLRYEISTPWYDTQNKLETIVLVSSRRSSPARLSAGSFQGIREYLEHSLRSSTTNSHHALASPTLHPPPRVSWGRSWAVRARPAFAAASASSIPTTRMSQASSRSEMPPMVSSIQRRWR